MKNIIIQHKYTNSYKKQPYESADDLFWLWAVTSEIYTAGLMERDYLPIQPGNGIFYYIYRFLDTAFFLLLFALLVILLLPGLIPLKEWSLGILVGGVILRAIGDHKYRPKKPEG